MKKKFIVVILSVLLALFLLSTTHILDFSKKIKETEADSLFEENLSKISITPKNRYMEIEKNEKNFILVTLNLSEENISSLNYNIFYLESNCNISKKDASEIILNPSGKIDGEKTNKLQIELLNKNFEDFCTIRYGLKIYSEKNLDERDFFDVGLNK